MIYLKQSTASQEVMFGPFVDSTDGVTAETGLTIANTDIRIQKAGAATFANKNSGGATHVEDGYYTATLDATDTDTLGSGVIQITVAGALPVRERFVVLAANVYDALIGGGDLLQVDLQQFVGNATAADILTKMLSTDITGTAQAGAAGTITLASGASATDDAYNNWWVTIVSGTGVGQRRLIHDYVGSTRVASVSPNWAVNPDNTSVYVVTLSAPAPTDAVALPDVNVNAWAGGTVPAPNQTGRPLVDLTHVAGAAQDVATQTLLTTTNANVVAAIADIATVEGKVDTANTHLTDVKGATFNNSTDSLEAIRDRGDAAWTTGAGGGGGGADELVTTTIATLASQTQFTLTNGSPDDDAYNNMLVVVTDSATSTQKAVAEVQDYVGSTRTVTLSSDPGIFTMAVGDAVAIIAVGGATALTAGAVADAVWDEALAGHVTAGTAGERMGRIPNAAAGGSGGLPTVDANNYVAGVQTITTAQLDAIADKVLGRNIAGGSDGGRTVTSALRVLRNKTVSAGAVFTVYEEDDSTPAWTAGVITEAGDPITEFDPS